MLAIGFIGIDFISNSLADFTSFQIVGICNRLILFFYKKPGNAALYIDR
jgi:hypothetical protein